LSLYINIKDGIIVFAQPFLILNNFGTIFFIEKKNNKDILLSKNKWKVIQKGKKTMKISESKPKIILKSLSRYHR